MTQFGGSWSESKLNCIEEYTIAYLRVMKKQSWASLHYVDAFAGRGKQSLPEGEEESEKSLELDSFFGNEIERAESVAFLEGSALRALAASADSERPFDHFTFIDMHAPSCHELESIIGKEYAPVVSNIDVRCEDANIALRKYINESDWSRTRALVFLDPFGLEVRWETIKELAGTGGCDVWYLFPLGGVLRMMTTKGVIPDSWNHRLTELFGTEKWYPEFYPATQPSLFPNQPDAALRDASTAHVVDYVRQRLRKVFPVVSNPAVLRNSKNSPLFVLVLGISNERKAAQDAGLRIANHLIRSISAPWQ